MKRNEIKRKKVSSKVENKKKKKENRITYLCTYQSGVKRNLI